MTNKKVDLHIHSYYSDGTLSLEEIIDKAIANNVGTLAVTDHNILEGSKEIERLCIEHNIKYISGVEIDAVDDKVNYHILGYGVDLENETFIQFIKNTRRELDDISIRLLEKMASDYDDVSVEDYNDYAHDRRRGGWKALNYFYDKGIAMDLQACFQIYSRYNITTDNAKFPSIEEVCHQIHKAGGKAVIAHVGRVIKTDDKVAFKKELLSIIERGIDGIECYYPSHSEETTNICLDICKSKGLLITCGSDCHGNFEGKDIGFMNIGEEDVCLDDLWNEKEYCIE